MALRVMVYLGLLYQDLVQHRQVALSGKLPPVLPLVLYNGYAAWGAARELAELIEEVPGGLEQYRPRLRYCLLDEVRMADAELESSRNLVAALFRLEKSRGPEDIRNVLAALVEWLKEPELGELRRSFTAWLVGVLLPGRAPGITIPQVADLQEVRSMLAESVMEWTRQWKEEGRVEAQRESLEKLRVRLVKELEKRFGPLSEQARHRVEAIGSDEEIVEFSLRVGGASSLSDLGLA
jgi:hypothetical protein